MSKSQGNYVGIDDPPEQMFGKVMSIPDSALDQWWRLTLDREPPAGDPMESKLALARALVELYHGPEAARRGEEHFTRVVRERQAPPEEDIAKVALVDGDPVHVPALLSSAFGISTSEARRLIGDGAVRVNGDVTTELDVPRASLEGALVQAGKRRYIRLTAP
jgi:tyrosyl-tRNA synthetase